MKNPGLRIWMLDGFNEGWIDFEGASIKGSIEFGRTYEFNGKITLVGAPEKALPVSAFALLFGNKTRRSRVRLSAASPKRRHARLLRPAQHHRRCRGDLDPAVNEAHERMLKSDVKYRFSIDMASLKS
jgi:uncharacterized zinc-type alcohol dehydrogenase-like protein